MPPVPTPVSPPTCPLTITSGAVKEMDAHGGYRGKIGSTPWVTMQVSFISHLIRVATGPIPGLAGLNCSNRSHHLGGLPGRELTVSQDPGCCSLNTSAGWSTQQLAHQRRLLSDVLRWQVTGSTVCSIAELNVAL